MVLSVEEDGVAFLGKTKILLPQKVIKSDLILQFFNHLLNNREIDFGLFFN